MKTEDELLEKIKQLKAMGSPSGLSKARELEWALGVEDEPDVESDMIVDTLMKNINTEEMDKWEMLPKFVRDHMMYTFWKQGDPLKVEKPSDWNSSTFLGKWDEQIAKSIEMERRKRGQHFSWRKLLGQDGFKDVIKNWKKNKIISDVDAYEEGFYTKIPDEAASIESAELIASLTKNGTHRPLLDIDFPAVVIPSSTPGHGHLYIDKELSWKDYQKLLNLFADLGIIEHGYRGASLARGYSALRLPWVKKETVEEDIIKKMED